MKNKIITIILLITCIFLVPKNIQAEEQNNPLGFSVEPVKSDNQIDDEIPYFYLKTTPGEKQKIQIKVRSTSEEDITIKYYLANAITGDNGVVNYKPKQEKDSSLKDSVEDIISIDDPSIKLKPEEEKIVTLTINSPADNYDGIKLGAVFFEKINSDKEQKSMVDNAYSFHIAIMLSESDEAFNDGKSFNLIDVKPELLRTRKTILLNLQNPEPKMISDLSMNIQIIDKKNNKVLKTQKLSDGSVAPNSNFNFAVDWGLDTVPAGKYTAKVIASSNIESWTLQKDFEITNEQAKKMNDETLYKLTIPTWAYIVTIILGVLTIVIFIYMLIRGKKWKEIDSKSKKKGRKSGKRRK